MGEVYRARDRSLDRDVAIKVLPEDLAESLERLARFERDRKLVVGVRSGMRWRLVFKGIAPDVPSGDLHGISIARSGRNFVAE